MEVLEPVPRWPSLEWRGAEPAEKPATQDSEVRVQNFIVFWRTSKIIHICYFSVAVIKKIIIKATYGEKSVFWLWFQKNKILLMQEAWQQARPLKKVEGCSLKTKQGVESKEGEIRGFKCSTPTYRDKLKPLKQCDQLGTKCSNNWSYEGPSHSNGHTSGDLNQRNGNNQVKLWKDGHGVSMMMVPSRNFT